MLLAATLVLELVRESLTGTHYRYRQYEHGLPTDTYITTKMPLNARGGQAIPPVQAGRIACPPPCAEGERMIDGRRIERRIVHESPHKPWQHDYDAASGALLRRTPLFFNAKPARIFDPNPVVTLNDPTLQDRNDGPVPEAAYRDVQLPDAALHGPWADLVDVRLPAIPPPEGNLVFDRTHDGFEPVNAYAHIHRSQEWVQSLGYRGPRAIAPYAVPVDAHATTEDNSFFIPSGAQLGRGTLFYGYGGTDDAEDADIVVHEYSHALFEWIAPGTFGGGFGSQSRALSEGTADYWAFSAHLDARRASGRDLSCIADWDARCWEDAASERCAYPPGSDCLRRVDSTRTMADYETSDLAGTEHRNGAIWSSALSEIRMQLPRDVADTIVLESLFGAPPHPTFAVMARRLLETDQLLYQRAHADVICGAMTARGILDDCGIELRGELTHVQSRDRNLPIPQNADIGVTSTLTISDPRAIEKLYVRVDIAHPSRGDLRIELIAPDGTVILLQGLSSSRTRDIHVTYGLTAAPAEPLDVLRGRSAAGTWTLRVSDRQPLDAGTLLSWGLDIQFAGVAPVTERPGGAESHLISVVAHLYGQTGLYASDLRIANPASLPRYAELIFTRSTKNGLDEFLATRVLVGAGQTVSFDDVVAGAFHTAGSGTLEVLGDVVVMSRTYLATPEGTYAQDVPTHLETTSRHDPALLVAPFVEERARYNLGLAETGGGRGTVRVAGRELMLEPFSHVQFPVGAALHEVRVVDGTARVAAYLSQVRGNDAMFIPALRRRLRAAVAPAITAQISGTPEWRSDFWASAAAPASLSVEIVGGGERIVEAPVQYQDVLAQLFHRTITAGGLAVAMPEGVFAATRIVHGDTTQFIGLPHTGDFGTQHVLFIENSDTYRTNVGIVSDSSAAAECIIYNAAGVEVERHVLVTQRGLAQVPVRARVANGRAEVVYITGGGRAYASVIDGRTGDATFFAGR
jgi:subtilisin-like proprotein convertase family protein